MSVAKTKTNRKKKEAKKKQTGEPVTKTKQQKRAINTHASTHTHRERDAASLFVQAAIEIFRFSSPAVEVRHQFYINPSIYEDEGNSIQFDAHLKS